MTATAVKCHCRNCNGHIEFDSHRAGESIACPHCGMDTALYIPGRASIPIEHGKVAAPKPDHTKAITLAVIILGIIVVFVAVGAFASSANGGSPLNFVGSGLGLILSLIIFAFAVLIAVLWVLFPVFVYYAIGRFEKILHQIEENTRRR